MSGWTRSMGGFWRDGRASADGTRAEPRPARPPATARARPAADSAGARAYRRHPEPVRPVGLRRALDAGGGLRPRLADAGARAAHCRPGDAHARDHPPYLEARLLAAGARRAPR